MAYAEKAAGRLLQAVTAKCGTESRCEEKKMFGGSAVMVRGHMCCGISQDRLMARIGLEQYAKALTLPHVSEMTFTGKPLRGYVFVAPAGYSTKRQLDAWVDRCLQFNAALPEK